MTFSTLTPLERAILHHIGPMLSSEVHIYLDEAGEKVLHHASHLKEGGDLADEVKARLLNGEKLKLLHNHPSGGSLSSFDWQVMTEHFGQLEMIVATPWNSVHRGRVNYDFQADEMKSVLPRLNTVFNEMSHLIRAPYISSQTPSLPVDAERVTSIFVNQRLFGLGIIDYCAELSLADHSVIIDLLREPLRNVWDKLLIKRLP
ncbi:hypothetical protein FS764_24945 [Agrobacterium vitis]|uniref:hypothetical protein n=1 Tax=Agrobacterium vitis TaxID=373 RepID=UPI001F34F730|nr:hypothetical protein [Agrobacterium vitis]MCF1470113.1 hypothetical protein [Agrobacterium vitis]